MAEPIRLLQVNVTAMVDENTDPYGQLGCSALWATFETVDPALIAQLRQLKEEQTSITIRCGALRADGQIGKLTDSGRGVQIVLSVDDIRCDPEIPIKRGLNRRTI